MTRADRIRVTDNYPSPFVGGGAAQRFEGGDAHVSVQQIAKHTQSTAEVFTELTINVDQVDPDDWPAFSKMIQELRPHLYQAVRIPTVINPSR
jgi:hypothetical protein